MNFLLAALAVLGLGTAVVLVRSSFDRITVFEYERGLRYDKGRLTGVLEAGRYWIYRPTTLIHKIDVRPAFVSIGGQEVMSSDGVGIRVSLAAQYEIADPQVAVNEVEDYQGALYLHLQLALREAIGAMPIEEVLDKRHELGRLLTEKSTDEVARIGLRLHSVDVKDVSFPGPLKKIFSQVVQARQEGLASLERARGETAALRNLANAARLVEGSPALMQLRLLQQLSSSPATTVVLGLPSSTTPLPLGGPDVEHPPPELEPSDDVDTT